MRAATNRAKDKEIVIKPLEGKRGRPGGHGRRKAIVIVRRYWAAETMNLVWAEETVKKFIADFIELIDGGVAGHEDRIKFLARRYERKRSEIAVLIIDLTERGFISEKGRGRSKRKFNIDEL